MAIKTYVLLDTMDANAPVFQKLPNGERVQVKKIPLHAPTLRQEFYDKDGNAKVIRYKSHSKFIDQDKQIKEENIPANSKFTREEMDSRKFRFGILVTGKVRLQEFIESHPEFEGFDGTCDTIRTPKYKLLDKVGESKIKNDGTRLMVKAVNKVLALSLEEAQAMLIRLNGSFFETPNVNQYEGSDEEKREAATNECQNMLINFINDSESEKALNAVLKEDSESTVDEKTTVLIGSLINAKLLSFNEIEGAISKFSNGKWVTVREISTEYPTEERQRLFNNFLNSNEGKPLKQDLEKDLKNYNKQQKE